jgi:hypothetical protein
VISNGENNTNLQSAALTAYTLVAMQMQQVRLMWWLLYTRIDSEFTCCMSTCNDFSCTFKNINHKVDLVQSWDFWHVGLAWVVQLCTNVLSLCVINFLFIVSLYFLNRFLQNENIFEIFEFFVLRNWRRSKQTYI